MDEQEHAGKLMFNELMARTQLLGKALELLPDTDAGYSFYSQILPEVKRLKALEQSIIASAILESELNPLDKE